jgi:hypothetical protein
LQVPEILDINHETQATQEMYGIGDPLTEDFGRRCLLARRLVEKGVRFVQVYTAGWDSHDYIERAHSQRIRSVDKPIHDQLLMEQVREAKARQDPDINALYRQGQTWEVS